MSKPKIRNSRRGALTAARKRPSSLLAAQATRFGYLRHIQGDLDGSVRAYRRALSLDPRRFDTWYALGCAFVERQQYGRAIDCLRHAGKLGPGHARVQFDLGRALFGAGEIEQAIDCFSSAMQRDPELVREALARIARYIPGDPRASNAAVLAARRKWANLEEGMQAPITLVPAAEKAPQDRVRIGYVSAFFGSSNWMKPVWGVINNHDRTRFEIHLFSDGDRPSREHGYLAHPGDRLHDLHTLSNREAAEIIARSGIDVLVDLNGYSFQDRLALFMLRPAKMIVGWFNMYATTGIDAFDYIIGDASVIPPEEEAFYNERVFRVPGSYLAFSVLYPVPSVVPPPCLATGGLTFGSLASHYKLNDRVIEVWAEILLRAPTARLLLKNRALSDSSNRARLLWRFRRHGVEEKRLMLEGPAPHYEFLAAYGRIDIALDTFPYSGGTTTSEGLWQGVPMLTFNGDRWASRTSRSLLLAAGLHDWCAPDLNAYAERAVTLATAATTPAKLAQLRMSVRSRLETAAVCDSVTLCRKLETLCATGRSK
jgi:protein O-GlcNAc transferase